MLSVTLDLTLILMSMSQWSVCIGPERSVRIAFILREVTSAMVEHQRLSGG